jgi:hypothetical protein
MISKTITIASRSVKASLYGMQGKSDLLKKLSNQTGVKTRTVNSSNEYSPGGTNQDPRPKTA